MKKEMNKKKKINSKGFTLVELLAAVAIVAILGTVGTPLVTRTIQTSKGKSSKKHPAIFVMKDQNLMPIL